MVSKVECTIQEQHLVRFARDSRSGPNEIDPRTLPSSISLMSLSELFFGFKPETIAKHAELFNVKEADPRERRRTTPLQVIAPGFPRCGTESLAAALRILGYETYHGYSTFANTRDLELWNPAFETKYLSLPSEVCPQVDKAFLDTALGHMNAVTDSFGCSFAEVSIPGNKPSLRRMASL